MMDKKTAIITGATDSKCLPLKIGRERQRFGATESSYEGDFAYLVVSLIFAEKYIMTVKNSLSILAAFAWISLSEFVRNQFLFKHLWEVHYQSMGLAFPAAPANGAVWGLWSLVFAGVIYVLRQRFSFGQTMALAWVIGFVMMWLVIGNLNVLPFGLLPYAVPLSLLECFVAVWIIGKVGSVK